jgi:hypothetical protein
MIYERPIEETSKEMDLGSQNEYSYESNSLLRFQTDDSYWFINVHRLFRRKEHRNILEKITYAKFDKYDSSVSRSLSESRDMIAQRHWPIFNQFASNILHLFRFSTWQNINKCLLSFQPDWIYEVMIGLILILILQNGVDMTLNSRVMSFSSWEWTHRHSQLCC